MGGMVRKFLDHVVPGVLRPLRILWHEIIGFLFLVFAAVGAVAVIRAFRNLDKPGGSPFLVLLSIFFALVMLYFGVTSFLRARKISRS